MCKTQRGGYILSDFTEDTLAASQSLLEGHCKLPFNDSIIGLLDVASTLLKNRMVFLKEIYENDRKQYMIFF